MVRDKTTFTYGDPICTFMKTLGQSNLVIMVLNAKYLHSTYCITELHALYQNAKQERQEFLNRIIPLVLKDARIGTGEIAPATQNTGSGSSRLWSSTLRALEKRTSL